MNQVMLRVNGVDVAKAVAPRTHLADFVREELHLTGTHLGCEHGVCGACTMIVDGRPIRACLSYAVGCAGSDVRTIEAFDDDPVMGLLRGAFSRHHALQCGYCTPGMLATAYDIVTRLPDADETRIREEFVRQPVPLHRMSASWRRSAMCWRAGPHLWSAVFPSGAAAPGLRRAVGRRMQWQPTRPPICLRKPCRPGSKAASC